MDVSEFIRDAGYTVLEAPTADTAMRMLDADHTIGLVFTDINMPGSIDGLQLATTLEYRWPPVKVIVTSGKLRIPQVDLPENCCFMAKPYLLRDVVAAIEELLRA